MTWQVQIRGKDNRQESICIDAESRSALFAELKKRGISAIRVTELKGRPRKVVSANRPPSRGKGLLAGLAIVVMGGAVIWFFMSKQEPIKEVPDAKAKKTSKAPAVVVPPKIPTDVIAESEKEVNKKKYPKNPWGTPIPEELEYKPHWKYTAEDYAKIDPGYQARHERFLEEQAKIPWKHPCECEIARLLFVKPGDPVLDMPVSKTFVAQFIKSLDAPIEISEDDSEEVAEQKREMIEVKAYLKEQLDKGEDIVDLLNQERKRLVELNGMRESLLQELREIEKTAKSEADIDTYVEAANIMLKERGAGEIKLPLSASRLRLRRAARAAQQNK